MRKKAIVLGSLVLLILAGNFMTAQDKAGPADVKREADRKAVAKFIQDYTKTFAQGDAKALAAFWTPAGEFIAHEGEVFRGRTVIEKAYAELFAKKEVRKVDIEIQSIRFPSTDTAIVEAALRRKAEDGELLASSWIHTLLVREAGRWQLALVREWDRDTAGDVALHDLAWLIGTWQAGTKEREVITTYEWDENKAFIRAKFTVKEAGKAIESGHQVIGKDNAEGVIRSWLFQSDGGFGGGVWLKEGNRWVVESAGVLPDGREMTATNIYVKVDANAFTWQSTERTLDGQPMPNTEPVRVTRQKAAK